MHYQVLFMTISHCIDMVPATGIPILLLPSRSHPAQQLVNSCGTSFRSWPSSCKHVRLAVALDSIFIMAFYDSMLWYPSKLALTLCFLHWWAQQRNKRKNSIFFQPSAYNCELRIFQKLPHISPRKFNQCRRTCQWAWVQSSNAILPTVCEILYIEIIQETLKLQRKTEIW